ncbi:unnamed protein product [Mytilus edulis]|uniref:Uncharacterized protein n=1 Tax=Mytilus edulis TaxID=6550 RepID=A0A8S3VQQ7_MYTED|nr:unnamed protein product [Mytilus edulis]
MVVVSTPVKTLNKIGRKSQNVYSRKQSIVEDEYHSDFFITSLGLKDTVIRLEREVNSLKGDHIQEIEYLNNTVSKLKKENKQLLDITSKNQERFKNFQNQITALRNTCENSNHQLSEFKIKFTQQNSQCDSHNEVISKLEKASSDLDKKLSNSAKDWDQLKHESGKLKNDTAILSKNYKGLQNDVKIESSRINQISDTRFLGVQSIKAKTDLLNDKVKEINDTLASTQEKSASFSQSITDIRKRLSKAEKEVNCLDKTSKSYANILTTKMDHMENISTVDSSYCSSELAPPDMHRTINITNNTEPEAYILLVQKTKNQDTTRSTLTSQMTATT